MLKIPTAIRILSSPRYQSLNTELRGSYRKRASKYNGPRQTVTYYTLFTVYCNMRVSTLQSKIRRIKTYITKPPRGRQIENGSLSI